jgi:hypothetical protein
MDLPQTRRCRALGARRWCRRRRPPLPSSSHAPCLGCAGKAHVLRPASGPGRGFGCVPTRYARNAPRRTPGRPYPGPRGAPVRRPSQLATASAVGEPERPKSKEAPYAHPMGRSQIASTSGTKSTHILASHRFHGRTGGP